MTTYQSNNIAFPSTITSGGYTVPSTSTFSVTGAGSGYTGAGFTLNTGAGVTGTISNGSTYTTSWVQPNTSLNNSNGKVLMSIPAGEDKLIFSEEAALEVKGTIKFNGVDLDERLKTIEKVLNIPQRDVTMEAKYPKLKKLYDEYMHELEKYHTWDRIKGENE